MPQVCLVTGANGHLGNNLVRRLLAKGWDVRAGIRDAASEAPLRRLGCKVVSADLHGRESLTRAMAGVDVLFQVAAVFRHWARNPFKEIIEPNIDATRNVMEAAAETGVSKVVYVSSIAAVDHNVAPLSEVTWNADYSNAYYRSKTESEMLAWHLAEKHGLPMVSVLPSVIVGPNCLRGLTPSMQVLHDICHNRMPFDPCFHFNYVDVRDVADGMIRAGEKGRPGQRYLLANERQTTSTELFDLARTLFPDTRKPFKAPRPVLRAIAGLGEGLGHMTGNTPPMMKSWIELYYKADYTCDISKSRKELEYDPRSPREALAEAFSCVSAE